MLRLQVSPSQQVVPRSVKLLQEVAQRLNGNNPVSLNAVSWVDIPLSKGDNLFGVPMYRFIVRILAGQERVLARILTPSGEHLTALKTFGSSKKELEELYKWIEESIPPEVPKKRKPKPKPKR